MNIIVLYDNIISYGKYLEQFFFICQLGMKYLSLIDKKH